jgi:ABC-type cobalamin/Fe3+-siderophores transport system ATPase subunit
MMLTKENYFLVNDKPVDVKVRFTNGLNLLTGPNGIGKSTFFNKLKSDVPELFGGMRVSFMDQFPLTPVNDVRLFDILKMMDEHFEHFDKNLADALIEKFKISYLLKRSITLLSGGENQLVKFILAVSQKVEFFFLDEPLQFLDKEKLILVRDYLEQLALNKCVFIIEHQADQLNELEMSHFKMSEKDGRIFIYGN